MGREGGWSDGEGGRMGVMGGREDGVMGREGGWSDGEGGRME